MGESPSFTATQDEYGRVAHTPLLQHRIMWASRPHSFTATQQQCGRVTHTPIAVYYTRRVQWLKQARPLCIRCLSIETACRFNRDFPGNLR
jgi:hypothetical protein